MAPTKQETTVDSGWKTVSEDIVTALPTKVTFDSYGDEFIGVYKGPKKVTPGSGEPFTVFLFEAVGDAQFGVGELCSVGSLFALRDTMKKVRPGATVRLTYVQDVQNGDNEIKDIRVDVRQ